MKTILPPCLILSSLFAFVLQASAFVNITFDDDVNPFSAGTISSDQSVSGNKSLFLGGEELVTFTLPPAYQNTDITITMHVFDQGKWTTTGDAYGPRWGVGHSQAGSDYVAGANIDKGTLPSDSGYGYHRTVSGDPFAGQFSDNVWFGPRFVSGSERQGLSPTSDDNSTGLGGWTEWTFDVSSEGAVTWGLVGAPLIDDDIGAAVSSIYLFGGDINEPSNLDGMYIDNITIVPEPASYAAILGLAVIGLAVWRRRRG